MEWKKANISRLVVLLISVTMIFGNAMAASDYPSKPVQIIVPWAVGGGTDTSTRALVNTVQKFFPRPLVVVNRPGGAGTVGMTEFCKSKPDGYTICSNAWGPMVTQPSLKKLQYTEKDYIPIMQTYSAPRILCAHPSRPYNNMKEFIGYVKKNPGKVKVGIAGVGTTGHLAMLQMESEYDVKFNNVSMGGGGPQKVAVLGGHVDVATLITGEGGPSVVAGQLKALGVFDTKRFPEFPNIPTLAEQGYPIESGVANFIMVRAGTPEPVIKFLHDSFKKGLEVPSYQDSIRKLKFNVEYLSPKESRAKLDKFRKLYKELIEKMGLAKK
jgi:tripartite-type tricarboxylate transporter receptor subunit TctC